MFSFSFPKLLPLLLFLSKTAQAQLTFYNDDAPGWTADTGGASVEWEDFDSIAFSPGPSEALALPNSTTLGSLVLGYQVIAGVGDAEIRDDLLSPSFDDHIAWFLRDDLNIFTITFPEPITAMTMTYRIPVNAWSMEITVDGEAPLTNPLGAIGADHTMGFIMEDGKTTTTVTFKGTTDSIFSAASLAFDDVFYVTASSANEAKILTLYNNDEAGWTAAAGGGEGAFFELEDFDSVTMSPGPSESLTIPNGTTLGSLVLGYQVIAGVGDAEIRDDLLSPSFDDHIAWFLRDDLNIFTITFPEPITAMMMTYRIPVNAWSLEITVDGEAPLTNPLGAIGADHTMGFIMEDGRTTTTVTFKGTTNSIFSAASFIFDDVLYVTATTSGAGPHSCHGRSLFGSCK